MTTDVTVVNQEELDAFAARTGATAEQLTGGGDFLPNLKVNYQDEDANGKAIKPGLLFVTNQDIPVYAESVTIRPLLHGYQWTQWDDKEKKTVNKTIFVGSFQEEARDEKGTVRCGKPTGKFLRDNPDQKDKYEDITLYRTIHALVSYDGKDADGNEHSVVNLPVVMRLKGDNFMPFGEEYIDNLPKGSRLWDFESVLTVEKRKQGTVNFWVIHYDTDFTKRLPLTVEVFDTMKAMQSRLDKVNKDINTKYYSVLKTRAMDDAGINVLDITPNSLDDDFTKDDDIPF